MTKLEDYIKVYKGWLNPEFCNEVRSEIEVPPHGNSIHFIILEMAHTLIEAVIKSLTYLGIILKPVMHLLNMYGRQSVNIF
jgi:hypothetical protein